MGKNTLTTRARKQVIKDETDAEARYTEAERQAHFELNRAYDAAEVAAEKAKVEASAEAASHTFSAWFKRTFYGDPL